MKIIILQLARLGDIIQTLPTIQGLKKSHPGAEITFVVRSSFADSARLSPHVDKLVEFPSAEVLGPVIGKPGEETRRESLHRLEEWFNRNFRGEYDLLLNLTFSTPSSYLAGLIRAKERRGPYRAADGTLVITDAWSQYLFSQILGRNLNVLHLNDVFARIAGVEGQTSPLELVEPATTNPVTRVDEKRLRIGIQVTASQPEKTLSAAAWGEICALVLAHRPEAELVFFGAKRDLGAINSVLAEAQAAMGDKPFPAWRCTILAGTMRFHENVHWLRSCSWLISPDTAIVHLSSAGAPRTRIVEIAVGDIRPEETGPYGEGHFVLYPVRGGAQELAVEICNVLDGIKAGLHVAQARTRLAKCGNGAVRSELAPWNFTPEESSNFFRWTYYLLAEFRCAGRLEEVDIPKLGDQQQKGAMDKVLAAYDGLCAMRRLAEFGSHYCLQALENKDDTAKLTELAAKVAEIDAMLHSLQKTVSLVKPLIDTWSVAKDVSFAPAGFDETIVRTEGAYRELKQNVDIIVQLLQVAVEAAQKSLEGQPLTTQQLTPRRGEP